MLKKIKIILPLIVFLACFGLTLASAPLVHSAGILPEAGGEPTTDCPDPTYCGNYELNDFMLLAVNIARWILGIVGSLSLVMFIYGGFMFLISGGSADSVQKAKKIILAAVIGLIIVFCSWLIIRFVLKTLNPNINWTGQELIVNKLK